MRSVKRILVAVKDPTAASLPAVAKAAQLARAFDAELELFHAIDSPVYVDMLGGTQERALELERTEHEHYLQRLERIAARVRLHARKVTVAAEWDYPGYEAIVRRAGQIDADLIVADAHRGHRGGLLLPPLTDQELVRLCALPLLLVRGARLYHHPAVLAALDPSHAFGKPPELDHEILQLGGLLARALHGELHAAHAVPRVDAQAERDFAQALQSSDIVTNHRHLLGGPPRGALCELAQHLKADVLVVGAVCRSGLWRLMIGNTAEQLEDLPCDLLIVKPADFTARVADGSRGAHCVTAFPLF